VLSLSLELFGVLFAVDPSDLPSMSFETIDEEQQLTFSLTCTNVCLNILDDEYDERLRLCDFAHALLWLLYNPEYVLCGFSSRVRVDAESSERKSE
jgi:hypothetical protein